MNNNPNKHTASVINVRGGITGDQMNAFTRAFDAGSHPGQRFGQAFINVYSVPGGPLESFRGTPASARIFFGQDREMVEDLIWADHVGG